MTRWQFGGQHTVALFNKMMAFDDWNFMPAVPVDIAIGTENRIKAGLVKWHVGLGMCEQLLELVALKRKHSLRQANTGFPSACRRSVFGIRSSGDFANETLLFSARVKRNLVHWFEVNIDFRVDYSVQVIPNGASIQNLSVLCGKITDFQFQWRCLG